MNDETKTVAVGQPALRALLEKRRAEIAQDIADEQKMTSHGYPNLISALEFRHVRQASCVRELEALLSSEPQSKKEETKS